MVSGFELTPAEPGDVVTLFGTGLGATTPPPEAGRLPEGLAPLASEFEVAVGALAVPPEDIYCAGAAACCVGLDKLVLGVPSGLRDLSAPVTAAVQGISTPGSPSSSWVGSAEHGQADPGRFANRRPQERPCPADRRHSGRDLETR